MMRRTAMRRTPFKAKPARPRTEPSLLHERIRTEVISLDENLLPSRARMIREKVAPGIFKLAGVRWPEGWMPEEPLKGFRRNRDTCFRWTVEDLLHVGKWKFWHLTEAKLSDPGFPDIIAFREREVWLELKVRDRNGKANGMSAEQIAFANTIIKAGGEFHEILWPDDWQKLEGLVL